MATSHRPSPSLRAHMLGAHAFSLKRAADRRRFPAEHCYHMERAKGARLALVAQNQRLLESLQRCAFLLNSSRLVIDDPAASDLAARAVADAQAVILSMSEVTA